MYEALFSDILNLKGIENISEHFLGWEHDVNTNTSSTPNILCGPTRAEFENAALTEDERNDEAFMKRYRQTCTFRDDPPTEELPPEEKADSETSSENNNNNIIFRTTQQINDRSSCTECLKAIPKLSPHCHGCGTPVGQSISRIVEQPNPANQSQNEHPNAPTAHANDGQLRVTSSSIPPHGHERKKEKGEVDEEKADDKDEKEKANDKTDKKKANDKANESRPAADEDKQPLLGHAKDEEEPSSLPPAPPATTAQLQQFERPCAPLSALAKEDNLPNEKDPRYAWCVDHGKRRKK
jgi:hypothetical protein